MTRIGTSVFTDGSNLLTSSSWNNDFGELDDFSSLSMTEKSDCFSRTLSVCNNLIECVNDDLQTVNTTVSHLKTLPVADPMSAKRDTLMAPQETLCEEEDRAELGATPEGLFSVSSTDSISMSSVVQRKQSTQTDEQSVESQRVLEENEALRFQLDTLQEKYDNLKETYDSAVEYSNLRIPSRTDSEGITSTASMSTDTVDVDWQVEDLHNQLATANQSLEELQHRVQTEDESQHRKQSQLQNLVLMMFILLVMFGALVMLGIVKISPGNLPMLNTDTTITWLDIWEHLF